MGKTIRVFEMRSSDLETFELDILADIGITIRRRISGEPGDYTKVFKGTYTNLKRDVEHDVAIKVINREVAPEVIRSKFLPRELETLRRLKNHKNIIKTLLIHQSETTDYIVSELARRDLYETVKIKGALSQNFCRRYFHNLVSGVEYLHSIQIAHRDIKCENCLIGMDGSLKIG